jgi:hypothetical protein
MSTYRWYSVGVRPFDSTQKIQILGWSRDRSRALAVQGTVEAYYASSRKMAARRAKADRGFEIEWRKF